MAQHTDTHTLYARRHGSFFTAMMEILYSSNLSGVQQHYHNHSPPLACAPMLAGKPTLEPPTLLRDTPHAPLL